MPEWGPRHEIAAKRLQRILSTHIVANARILEQKISDAGPNNQRIDPHILTEVRNALTQRRVLQQIRQNNVPWYHLISTPTAAVERRLAELGKLHSQTINPQFIGLLGQVLEIAIFRALKGQKNLAFFGNFLDLDTHDDSTLYSKEDPPTSLNGQRIPGKRKLDFLVGHPQAGYAGIEAKNIRPWIYPTHEEIPKMLLDCCSLDVVPILIARRIHYSIFSVLNPCGVIIHQTFNQLYPETERELAEQVKDKRLLGYHDVRLGNTPDKRLIKFIHQDLPKLLPGARQRFDAFHDLLYRYADGEHSYASFAARVKHRMRGESEDLPELEPEIWDDNY
ncbi:MAG TPA: hypothetical protein VLQ80_14410 [Candidatus Saccharimonadia bacterium]|nr:hypothetical protein [Candidatus Saccharimonadia bacterium]